VCVWGGEGREVGGAGLNLVTKTKFYAPLEIRTPSSQPISSFLYGRNYIGCYIGLLQCGAQAHLSTDMLTNGLHTVKPLKSTGDKSNLPRVTVPAYVPNLSHTFLRFNIDFGIFVNCNWVDTLWQQYSTHLHTNSTQNNTINLWTVRAVPRLCELYSVICLTTEGKSKEISHLSFDITILSHGQQKPRISSVPTLFKALLTYSMVHSPSWAANWFASSEEIPRISPNPKVHYRTHKSPPPVSILDQPNPVHIPTSHLQLYPAKFRAKVQQWYQLLPVTEGTVMTAICHNLCEETSSPIEPQKSHRYPKISQLVWTRRKPGFLNGGLKVHVP